MQLMWSCSGLAPVKALLIGKRLCQMAKTALHLHHQVIACTLLQPLGYIWSAACMLSQRSQCAPCFSLHHSIDSCLSVDLDNLCSKLLQQLLQHDDWHGP